MANKTNLAFFNAYLELDKICNQHFEISKGGVTTYINRLIDLRFVPERSEVLPILIKYRKLRNIIAHEADAFSDLDEITKDDVKWLNDFAKSVEKKSDPVSRYERRSRRNEILRKLRIALIGLGAVAVLAIVLIILKVLNVI